MNLLFFSFYVKVALLSFVTIFKNIQKHTQFFIVSVAVDTITICQSFVSNFIKISGLIHYHIERNSDHSLRMKESMKFQSWEITRVQNTSD